MRAKGETRCVTFLSTHPSLAFVIFTDVIDRLHVEPHRYEKTCIFSSFAKANGQNNSDNDVIVIH